MINETILAVLLGYGVFAWSVVEKAKPTLRKGLESIKKDTDAWQAVTFQVVALAVVFVLLIGDTNTRAFAIIGRTPETVGWEAVDLIISCTLAFQSNEAAHRLIDLGRVFYDNRKEAIQVIPDEVEE